MDPKVNFSFIVAYTLVALLSRLANDPIRNYLIHRFGEDAERYDKMFDLSNSAAFIGIIERFIYIFAVMIGQYTLISGWITMKAFAKWLEKSKDESDSIVIYNHYIIGNGVSLLTAIVLGEVGVLIRSVLGG